MGKSTAVTCEVCGTQIGRKADLKRHMMVHAENKEDLKHPCPYPGCTFKTLQKSNLNGHMNTHTWSRPYKCRTEGCGFKTSDRGSLTRHRKELHGGVPRTRAETQTAGASEAAKPSTSSSVPGRSTSPMEALPDTYHTPLPELPQTLGPCPLLVPPADSMTDNSSKSNLVAPRTNDFMGYPWVNNEQYPLVNNEVSSPSSGSLMSEEASMLDYMPVSATVGNRSLPVASLSPNAVNDTFMPSAGLYVDNYNYTIDNTPIASSSQFVDDYDPATSNLSGCDSTVNNAGYEHRGVGSFNFGDSLFAPPGAGVRLQDVDQMYSYIIPLDSMYLNFFLA